ncbi:UNVERIFIED_CONTAM: Glutamate receptor 3.7 [Sesamum angustifolium]|uniref:Glutamate receptor 3.7 n=1 Tax=Sesamum angustifolium TaxID=2727405 RepID=A0AAW2KYS1_9LAMI
MELSVMAVVSAVLVFLVLVVRPLQCEQPAVVKVGAVFTFDSVIGRGAKIAMEMAVEDINSDPRILNGTQLRMVMEDPKCSAFMGSVQASDSNQMAAVADIIDFYDWKEIIAVFVDMITGEMEALGPRVYVVHIDPDPSLKFFRIVKKLDMITSNYIWLTTDWLSSTLDSLPEDRDSLEILQG